MAASTNASADATRGFTYTFLAKTSQPLGEIKKTISFINAKKMRMLASTSGSKTRVDPNLFYSGLTLIFYPCLGIKQ